MSIGGRVLGGPGALVDDVARAHAHVQLRHQHALVLPSGRVTFWLTSQTMSLVSCAICSALSAMPGVSPYSRAKVAPAFISAMYCASSLPKPSR